jgi:hypothetical protein
MVSLSSVLPFPHHNHLRHEAPLVYKRSCSGISNNAGICLRWWAGMGRTQEQSDFDNLAVVGRIVGTDSGTRSRKW